MTLREAIGLDSRDVVALVGGGGKTTALLRLGSQCAALGERVLLQSAAFESPKACGAYVSALKTSKKVEDASLLADGVDVSEVESALVQLIAAETARKEAKT